MKRDFKVAFDSDTQAPGEKEQHTAQGNIELTEDSSYSLPETEEHETSVKTPAYVPSSNNSVPDDQKPVDGNQKSLNRSTRLSRESTPVLIPVEDQLNIGIGIDTGRVLLPPGHNGPKRQVHRKRRAGLPILNAALPMPAALPIPHVSQINYQESTAVSRFAKASNQNAGKQKSHNISRPKMTPGPGLFPFPLLPRSPPMYVTDNQRRCTTTTAATSRYITDLTLNPAQTLKAPPYPANMSNPQSSISDTKVSNPTELSITDMFDFEHASLLSSNNPAIAHQARNFPAVDSTTNIVQLKIILTDFRWVQRHAISGTHGVKKLVTEGYDVLLASKTEELSRFEREGYRLIRNALMLINPILRSELDSMKDTETERQGVCAHLASQLYGRLLSASRDFAVILTLLESIRTHVKPPWLRPLNPCFDAPKTDIALAVKTGQNSLASAVAISADGEFVVTPGDPHHGKNTVRVWEVATGNCITIICTTVFQWLTIAITPNKKTVITSCTAGDKSPLMFWNIMDEKRRFIKEVKEDAFVGAIGQKNLIFNVAVHPNNKSVIGASDGSIRMWNLERGVLEREFMGVSGFIYDLDLTPDGSLLVAGVTAGAIGLWNVSNGERLLVIKNEDPTMQYPITFHRDCDSENNRLPDKINEIIADRLYCVSFMADRVQKAGAPSEDKNIKIVCGGGENVRIWNLPDLRTLTSGESFDVELVKTLCFPKYGIINNIRCTDENTMFFGSGDGCVRMAKLKDELKDDRSTPPIIFGTNASGNRKVTKMDPVFISVSDNGQKVATGTDRPFVLVWDVGQYEETLKENSGVLSQPPEPFNMELNRRKDSFQNNMNDLKKILYPSRNPKRELRIDKQNSKENVFKLQVLPSQDARTIVFDRNIDFENCRVGVFSKSDEMVGAGDWGDTDRSIAREGLSIRLKDGSTAVFEAERGIVQQRAKVP